MLGQVVRAVEKMKGAEGGEATDNGELIRSENVKMRRMKAIHVPLTSSITARGESGFVNENILWVRLPSMFLAVLAYRPTNRIFGPKQ